MRQSIHTYEEDLKIGVEYSYTTNYIRVYNIKELRRKFNRIINKLETNNKKCQKK